MEGAGNGGSDDEQLPVSVSKMIEEISTVMKKRLISTIHQEIVPIFEDLARKVVFGNSANEMTMSKEKSLYLKFSDEGKVSDPVLTGKEIKGKGEMPMEVYLLDEATGKFVSRGPESSSEVEILVLDASGDDNEQKCSHESFNSRIIREGDDDKPCFAKRTYISLKEGFGVCENVKFRHIAKHTRRCRYRLGARIKENLRGINVQEAWTKPFEVLDSRSKLYKKRYPPSLTDEVWRLKNIGKDGEPRKRLEKENIKTVEDFLFLHSIDPQRLQQIVGAPATMWKATLDHAGTCTIGDKKMYLHYPSAESKMGVIFDAVGGLKGVIGESYYVPVNSLSSDEKDCAHKLLLSAFENRKERTSFKDEPSLLQKFPYRSSVPSHENSNISGNYSTGPDPGTSSQSITRSSSTLNLPHNDFHLIPLDLPITGQIYEQNTGARTPNPILEPSADDEKLVILFDADNEGLLETILAETSHQHSLVRPVWTVILWLVLAKKMTLGSIHTPKKQRS